MYDASSQKRQDAGEGSARGAQGVKRRRQAPRLWEDDVDELQSIYGHLTEVRSSPDQKSDPRAIEARLDKLMSMIEHIGAPSHALEAEQTRSTVSKGGLNSTLVDKVREDARNDGSVSSRPASPRRAAADSSGDEFPIPSGQATDLVDPVGSLNLGHLSLEDGGRSR